MKDIVSLNSWLNEFDPVKEYTRKISEDAANNEGGAMNGFMGVGMVNMASGGMFGGAVNNAMNNQYPQAQQGVAPQQGVSYCSNCGNPVNGGNYCTNCGNKLN